jgi:hypothetical protein
LIFFTQQSYDLLGNSHQKYLNGELEGRKEGPKQGSK